MQKHALGKNLILIKDGANEVKEEDTYDCTRWNGDDPGEGNISEHTQVES